MFIPEYSITPKTLKNIAIAEYSKAVVENTAILPSWTNQLKKEAKTLRFQTQLKSLGILIDPLKIKSHLEGIEKEAPIQLINLLSAETITESSFANKELSEEDLKEIAKTINGNSSYRALKVSSKTNPEEILAKIVQFFDWFHSLDGKETHPIILSAIAKAFFENLEPFKEQNRLISEYFSSLVLNVSGYGFNSMLCPDAYYEKTKRDYETALKSITAEPGEPDYTSWIEYYSEGLSIESANLKEKVKLLARDTKIAKATGRVKFTPRQERIVEYLQDYGILQNRDFSRVFSDTSEDSVLRDLKVLINKGVIQKSGSTKSSYYELA